MSFWYDIPVPELLTPDGKAVRLVEWLLQVGDEFHAGTRLAILETSSGRFAVLTNGDGFLRKILIPAGAELTSGVPLARADADGERFHTASRIHSPSVSKMPLIPNT